MLYVPPGGNGFAAIEESTTARATNAMGTSVTPAVGSKGSWAEVIASTAFDSFGILINVNNNRTNNVSRSTTLDVGVGAASSEVVLAADLLCGSAAGYVEQTAPVGFWYWFPIFIPAGTRIAIRAQSTEATAFNALVRLSQKSRNPLNTKFGSFVETLGITAPNGTAVTMGTTSDGAWTSIGTTTKPWFGLCVGFQVPSTDTNYNLAVLNIDVAVGDGTNFDIVISGAYFSTGVAELAGNNPFMNFVERHIPAGSTIYVRIQTSGTADSAASAIYGVG